MKKKKKQAKTILEKYNEREAKGNVENTLLKGAVDTVAGSVIGTGIGAIAGTKSTLAGIAMILAGHYLGDESGLLRVTGASTLAYGIGKAKEYKENPELDSPSNRLAELKDDFLIAFYQETQPEEQSENKTIPPNSTVTVEETKETPAVNSKENSEIDISGLDVFLNKNEQMATDFEKVKKVENEEDLESLDEDPDLSLI